MLRGLGAVVEVVEEVRSYSACKTGRRCHSDLIMRLEEFEVSINSEEGVFGKVERLNLKFKIGLMLTF